ncbi:MAG: hypothetical protein KAW12_27555 [Candidatus Aminicenantes bacterium]|nr:hypothetical protein [Candidatus Aminicenantes bacterium]
MIEFLLGSILSGGLSWAITHLYHVKSNKEQRKHYEELKKFISKLPEDFKKIVLEDKRDTLTVPELNDLLKKKTIDDSIPGEIKYKACPECGSENLVWDENFDTIVDVDVSDGEPFFSGTPVPGRVCRDCGWGVPGMKNHK